jgi:O-antigen ligase
LFALYHILSDVFGLGLEDIFLALFNDRTFTGRTTIWAFAVEMSEHRPWLGWGYQSFWLIGPTAPSVLEAPGWVADMPHAHNGYLDTMLETGILGLALLLMLIVSTLRGIDRLVQYESRRTWLVLSVLFFTIVYNGFESTWVRSFDIAWVVFLILAAERPAENTGRGALH